MKIVKTHTHKHMCDVWPKTYVETCCSRTKPSWNCCCSNIVLSRSYFAIELFRENYQRLYIKYLWSILKQWTQIMLLFQRGRKPILSKLVIKYSRTSIIRIAKERKFRSNYGSFDLSSLRLMYSRWRERRLDSN